MKRPTIYDRIREALKNGPLTTYQLAHILWPPKENPRAWNYSSNGGPPAWVRCLGKAAKAMKLNIYYKRGDRYTRWVALPRGKA